MLLVVAEPWGRLFDVCHGGSATDCTAPPCWSQIVCTSRSSCDLRRCLAPDGGNPSDIHGVPSQTTACNRSPPAPPSRRAARPRTQEGGDPRHLPWERPGLLTEALARSERPAGGRPLPRPAARFMSGVPSIGVRPAGVGRMCQAGEHAGDPLAPLFDCPRDNSCPSARSNPGRLGCLSSVDPVGLGKTY